MKNMKKRIYSLMLAVLLLFSLFPAEALAEDGYTWLYVGGMDFDNTIGTEDKSIVWDADTATLTLTDASMEGYTEIDFTDTFRTLTVKLRGTNTITSQYGGIQTNGNLVVEAEPGASLEISSLSEEHNAFWSQQELTIRGGKYILSSAYPAICSDKGLTIEGADITAETSAGTAICAVDGDLNIGKGASVTVTFSPWAAFYAAERDINIGTGASVTVVSTQSAAVYAEKGSINISGQGTKADLTADLCALTGAGGVKIGDHAVVTTSTSDASVYSSAGNVLVDGGADLTAKTSTNAAGIYAAAGTVTISGQDTTANLTTDLCALNGVNGITISDGAVVTGSTSSVASESAAFYSANGPVTVSGQGTKVDFTSRFCVVNGEKGVTVSDHAVFIGTATENTPIYSPSGAIQLLSGADVRLTSTQTGMGAMFANNENTMKIENCTLHAETKGPAVTCLGDIDVTDSTVTLLSEASNTFNGKKDLHITGKSTNITAEGGLSIYASGSIEIQEATISSQSAAQAFYAVKNLSITNGANVTAKTTGQKSAIYSKSGDINLDGDETEVNAVSEQGSALSTENGRITLNAHVTANACEGMDAVIARQGGLESASGKPDLLIEIGENYIARKHFAATTGWKLSEDDSAYYAETALVPRGTVLNGEGLLDDGYTPSNSVEITKKIDRTTLQAAIDAAKMIPDTDETKYTKDSWTAFKNALKAAEATMADQDAGQEEAAAATDNLTAAQKALKEKVDTTRLQAAIDMKVDAQDTYTPSSWKVYTDALNAAKEALAQAKEDVLSQNETDAAAETLEKAVKALTKRADRTTLQAAIDAAKAIPDTDKENYTEDSWTAFKDALAEAEKMAANAEASQEQVSAAADSLTAAQKALEEVSAPKEPVTGIFEDVKEGDWFLDEVQYVYDHGIMTGLDATHFGPSGDLSRAQFAVILWRLEGEPKVEYTPKFPDVPGEKEASDCFFRDAVMWASSEGIINGYEDGSRKGLFGPADAITREQLAAMLFRYATFKKYDTTAKKDLSGFPDGGDVTKFAKDAMVWATGAGIITGNEDKTLAPQGKAGRAQAATMIQRFLDNVVK